MPDERACQMRELARRELARIASLPEEAAFCGRLKHTYRCIIIAVISISTDRYLRTCPVTVTVACSHCGGAVINFIVIRRTGSIIIIVIDDGET